MNETLQVIECRRSTRAYAPETISAAEREAILHAAMRAPTAGNMMLYTIIEVEDQAIKDRLAVTCDHQPFIARAPLVLLFAADYQRWFDYFTASGVEARCQELDVAYRKPATGDMLLACCDAMIAAQTAVIAAESLGIGSCYIGDILENYETHRDLLALPPYVVPISLVCFGYPVHEHAEPGRTSRFDPEFIVHKNTYHRLDAEEQERMFAHMTTGLGTADRPFFNGAKNFGQHVFLRKFNAEFSWEMSRSVREILKNWENS